MSPSHRAVVLHLITIGMITSGLGCAPSPKSGTGFTLPSGDANAGKMAFQELRCNACHKIAGIEQPIAENEKPEMSVPLGGEVTRIKTYGELVTSIINPSHRLARGLPVESISDNGQSKMPSLNSKMTVQQLIDLVTFLQSQYKLREFQPTEYPMYNL